MPKLALISIAVSALIFVGLIPFLEISSTHLFSPDWTPHARFHNAWQLMANAALSILALLLVWKGNAPRLGMGIALMINITLLFALLIGSLYGGSTIVVTDPAEKAIGGINIAAIVIGVSTALLLLGYRALGALSKI